MCLAHAVDDFADKIPGGKFLPHKVNPLMKKVHKESLRGEVNYIYPHMRKSSIAAKQAEANAKTRYIGYGQTGGAAGRAKAGLQVKS